ncbi:MAG: Holliday junction resolvase RuvX [Planctomycetaceae bacterium]
MTVWQRQSEAGDARFIKKLVEENQVVGLVVGLPVHMSGDEGGVAAQARQYGDWLAETVSLPVQYWDERFTSAKAETLLYSADLNAKQRKEKIDKLAAHIILQSFLDAEDRNQLPPSFND